MQTLQILFGIWLTKNMTLSSLFEIMVKSECGKLFPELMIHFSSFQSLSRVWLFETPWIAARQASLSITNSRNLPKLMSIESVMPSNHLILCHSLLLFSVFPSIRVFSNKSTLLMRCPKYWSFSFSISPSNVHAGLISFRMDCLDLLEFKGLSRVFSNTTVNNINSLVLSFLYGPILTSIHDYWKNRSFD